MKTSQWLLVACIAVGFVFLCGLGIWQVQRLQWKEAMIERVEKGTSSAPVPLSEIETVLQADRDIEYRPTFAEGTFDHNGEQHFFAVHKGKPGYFVYTPMRLDDGRILFVNRGYVPIENKDSTTRKQGQTKGRVRVEGLARSAPGEKPNSFVPDNDLAKNVYYWKSLSQMAGNAYDKMEYRTVNFFLDANAAPVPGGLPVGGVTRISFPNNHLGYAITWFGLALALLGVGAFFIRSRARNT